MKRVLVCSALTWVFTTGCGSKSDEPSGDCDTTTPVTFNNNVETILAANCTRCHSSTLSGAARNGAPSSFNWDVYSSASSNADRIYAQASADTMPPDSADVSATDVCTLRAWSEQGAPE